MPKPKRSAPPSPTASPEPEVAPVAVVNPIVERGFVPSPDEYDLLSNVVLGAAKLAAQQGMPAIQVRLREILGRLSQIVQAPSGLRPEQIDRYRSRVLAGLRERDSDKIVDGVQDLVAATFRTDPDPGYKIAGYLLQLVGDIVAQHRNMSTVVLERLDAELDLAAKDWDSKPRWPDPQATLAWIRDVIAVGVEDLRADRDPWTEGDDESDLGEADTPDAGQSLPH